MGARDELVQVYASGDTFAAELMRGRLEAEDIPVLVKGEGEGPYRMGPLYLWVSAQDATRGPGGGGAGGGRRGPPRGPAGSWGRWSPVVSPGPTRKLPPSRRRAPANAPRLEAPCISAS